MSILDKISVDLQHEATLAGQLRQQFTWLIATGQLRPGDRLPPLRNLARHLGINLHTVRAAYLRLAEDGLVVMRQWFGTRVLAYDPVRLAQAAGSLRSHTVGIILPSMANPFYHPFVEGVESVASEDHTMLFVCNTHDDSGEALRYLNQLSAKGVDGVIVVSHDVAGFPLPPSSLGPDPLPVISVDWPDSGGYSVLMDLASAGYQATRHLLDHGHSRVGLVTAQQPAANVDPIESGYWRALREAGIAPDLDRVARVGGFAVEHGAEGARRLLALSQPPTAIFAIADVLAIGALREIKGAGLRVPEDVALVGFNDCPIAALVDPPLTTVAAPARQMGVEAMKMLQCLIAGTQPCRGRVLLPVSLVIRRSCGTHESTFSN
jgi:DNA-binding LacI/PurR family transcriptional regulator